MGSAGEGRDCAGESLPTPKPCLQTRAMRALARTLALTALLVVSRARAGNDDSILLGNDAALVAGAVVSNSNDGSALWYNPAGLARATQSSLDASASAFALRRYKMPGLISAVGGRGGDASFTEIVSIPSALTYVRRWGDSMVGLGLFASQVQDFTLRASLGFPVANVVDGQVRMLLRRPRVTTSRGAGANISRAASRSARRCSVTTTIRRRSRRSRATIASAPTRSAPTSTPVTRRPRRWVSTRVSA